ncbi:MAG TPA: alpha-E domain-containing protein, partial [Opitutales bacterium]|nr:alpha-E domain-containing protein [Opitutales bacterium]
YLHQISGTPLDQQTNDAERICGKMLTQLSKCTTEDIFKEGLHEYLDRTQISLNNIGQALYQSYMYVPAPEQPATAA